MCAGSQLTLTVSLVRAVRDSHLQGEEAGLVPVDPHHVAPPLLPKHVPVGGGQGHEQQVRLLVRPGEAGLVGLTGLTRDLLPGGHWRQEAKSLRELSAILCCNVNGCKNYYRDAKGLSRFLWLQKCTNCAKFVCNSCATTGQDIMYVLHFSVELWISTLNHILSAVFPLSFFLLI